MKKYKFCLICGNIYQINFKKCPQCNYRSSSLREDKSSHFFIGDDFLRKQVERGIRFEKENDTEKKNKAFIQAEQEIENLSKFRFFLALNMVRIQKYDKARQYLEQILEKTPENENAHALIAYLLELKEKPEKAISILETIYSTNPENLLVNMQLSSLYIKKKNYEKARKCLEYVIEKDPNNIQAWLDMGVCFGADHKFKKALECFETVLRLDPEFCAAKELKARALRDLGKNLEALELFDEITIKNSDKIGAWMQKGLLLRKMKHGNEAIECFEKALELNPDNIGVRSMLIAALNDFNQIENAYQEIFDYVLANIFQPFIWSHLSKMLASIRKMHTALIVANLGLQYFPENPEIYLVKGEILATMNRLSEARDCINKALTLKADYKPAIVIKNNILNEMRDDFHPFNDLKELPGLEPKQYYDYYNKAVASYLNGEIGKARVLLNQALEMNPDDSRISAFSEKISQENPISEIKPSFICKCGEDLNENTKFCVNCGVQTKREPPKKIFSINEFKEMTERDWMPLLSRKPQNHFLMRSPPSEILENQIEPMLEAMKWLNKEYPKEAVDIYDLQLEKKRDSYIFLHLKAKILIQYREYTEALRVTDDLLYFYPLSADGWYNRGLAYFYKNKLEKGLRCCVKALTLEPNHYPSKNFLENLFHKHPNNFQQVISHFKESLRKMGALLNTLFQEIEPTQFISFRIIEITEKGFVESAVKRFYDLEFLIKDYKEFLPRIMFNILLDEGYFLIHQGKITDTPKKTLLFGALADLFGKEMMISMDPRERLIEATEFHSIVKNGYEELRRKWKTIWKNEDNLFLHSFYNLNILENYLIDLMNVF